MCIKSVNTTFKKKRLHLDKKINKKKKKNVQSHTLIINAALCVSVSVSVFSQCEDENNGLIGDAGSPAGVSGSTKRSVISIRLVA